LNIDLDRPGQLLLSCARFHPVDEMIRRRPGQVHALPLIRLIVIDLLRKQVLSYS
jgi:hypothetical protein